VARHRPVARWGDDENARPERGHRDDALPELAQDVSSLAGLRLEGNGGIAPVEELDVHRRDAGVALGPVADLEVIERRVDVAPGRPPADEGDAAAEAPAAHAAPSISTPGASSFSLAGSSVEHFGQIERSRVTRQPRMAAVSSVVARSRRPQVVQTSFTAMATPLRSSGSRPEAGHASRLPRRSRRAPLPRR